MLAGKNNGNPNKKNKDLYLQHTRTYMALRKAVGWICILLPFTLMVGNYVLFDGKIALRSISVYYYSQMHDLFVGALCAVGFFMFFYSGYGNQDRYSIMIAGILILGVAFFPTTLTGETDLVGMIHNVCAISLFVLMPGISIFHFPRKRLETKTRVTDKFQMMCGVWIIVCDIAIGIYYAFFCVEEARTSFVFLVQSVALIAFGLSWLTEGWDLNLEIN